MLTKESYQYIKHLPKSNQLFKTTVTRKLFSTLENITYTYDRPTITTKNIQYPHMEFIPSHLMKKTKTYNKGIIVSWTVYSTYKIDCKLTLYQKSEKINKNTINLMIYIISFIVSLSDRDRTFAVNIVLLPDKKLFNKKFTPTEINSGLCSSNLTEAEIFVWRKEECIKVLIHELIHGLQLSDIKDTPAILNHYNAKYNINCSRITLDETYTEIWAKIFNCYLVVRLTDDLSTYEHFARLLLAEKTFSMIQSWKIRKYLQDDYKKKKVKKDLNQHTNVVAYYLAISEVFDKLDSFLEFRFRNKNIFYLKNNHTFNNFMISSKFVANKIVTPPLFNKSFRMSAIELKV